MNTISITDYSLLTPTLAKVIVAWTGEARKDVLASMLTDDLKYLAQPVENSFRRIGKNAGVGFLRANREVRPFDESVGPNGIVASRARYKIMSSNIMMDNKDRTLWELREGPGGSKFLARHGHENLAELVEAATNHRRQDVPRLSRVTIARAAQGEFAAFCGTDGNMDHGFVTRTAPSKTEVVSMTLHRTIVVPNTLIASLHQVKIDGEVHQGVLAALKDRAAANKAAEYWKELYGYDPSYAEKFVHYTNSDAVI